MFFSSPLLKPYKSLNRLECSKLQRLKIHLRNLPRRMNHIHNERMYPSLRCLENLVLFQMKNYQTHYFVADADGVDAVLYDTGPVNENSPGMTKKSSI